VKSDIWWSGSLFSGSVARLDAIDDEDDYGRTSSGDRKYRGMVYSHFNSLVGSEVNYYGADSAEHAFKIDDIVFKVLEDPNDGYRSCLGVIEYGEQNSSIFFHTPVARVRIEIFQESSAYGNEKDGYRLVDVKDGHVWLEFGTDHTDDYYPMFVFNHHPRGPSDTP